MKHRTFIWFCAMLWIIALPALSAFQVDQTAGSAATAEKKAKVKTKAKKAEQADQTESESATSKTRETTGAHRQVTTVPESEIAAAKASGKVWVNTETGVYHKSGQWYCATKQGKFMTEQEAIKSGYRAAKSK